MRNLAPLGLLMALACTHSAPPGPPPTPLVEPAPDVPHTRIAIDRPDLHGVSGMDRGPGGHLFMVLERDHSLFELRPDGHSYEVVGSRAVLGAPGSVDLESMAFLDETHLVFGTETTDVDRTGDLLLFAELQPDKVVIGEERVLLEYAPWGITPERNRGIEGLCQTRGLLVAAVESAGEHEGRRFAPVATYDTIQKKWRHYRVWLTSKTGKISALSCRNGSIGAEVLAIERHYEVSRIIRFVIPAFGNHIDLDATMLVDTAPLFEGEKIPNFEGLVWQEDRSTVSVSDNDYGGITGPTQMLKIPAPPVVHPSPFTR